VMIATMVFLPRGFVPSLVLEFRKRKKK
jgi:hypothetical protein